MRDTERGGAAELRRTSHSFAGSATLGESECSLVVYYRFVLCNCTFSELSRKLPISETRSALILVSSADIIVPPYIRSNELKNLSPSAHVPISMRFVCAIVSRFRSFARYVKMRR